jgi:hypothetical protein
MEEQNEHLKRKRERETTFHIGRESKQKIQKYNEITSPKFMKRNKVEGTKSNKTLDRTVLTKTIKCS